ncbi:MAG: sugar transferase [Planctomycetota bacterium]
MALPQDLLHLERGRFRPICRLFDTGLAAALLLSLLPLFALTVLVIRCGGGGPAFFFQSRVGRNGTFFLVYKLRTMNRQAGPGLTAADDARVTKIGGGVRRYRIDEWPQMLNILVGQMSFVGPRPELPCFLADYGPHLPLLLSVRPGLTDPATLASLDEAEILRGVDDPEAFYREHLLPKKLALSARYKLRRNFCRDLAVLLQTGVALIRPGRKDQP